MTCGALCWYQSLMRSHANSCSEMWRTQEVEGEREKELYSSELLFQLYCDMCCCDTSVAIVS